MKKINFFIKRMIDIVGSFAGLTILSPILIIIVLLIRIDSKGKAFFTQERLGKNGKTFKIFKFRTMVVNAEELGDGLSIKNDSDSRITKIGKILRKTSLDELPQLWNVLIGEMSLVGPRPPVTYHPYEGYENYPLWAKMRFEMRPGVTGLAQVTVRNSVSWDERIKIDIKYIENFQIFFDIKILYKTLLKVVKHNAVYAEETKNV